MGYDGILQPRIFEVVGFNPQWHDTVTVCHSHLATGDHHWKMSMRSAADSQDSALLQLLLFFFNLTLQAFHHRLRGRVKSVKRRSQSTRLPVSLEDDCRFYMLLSCSISIFCHLHRHILLQQIAISTDPTLRAAPAASLCFAFQPPVAPELLPAVSSPHARTLQECHLNSSMAMATLW